MSSQSPASLPGGKTSPRRPPLGRAKGSAVPAVFVDRDGVLVKDVGYLLDPRDLELQPGTAQGIRRLQKHFLIVVVTNQSPISRGMLSTAQLGEIHTALRKRLRCKGAHLDKIYFCPHQPGDDCDCRKPKPGLLFQARDELGIDLPRSFLVGDKGSDILAGQRAGLRATILISSHQTKASLNPSIIPSFQAQDLDEATEYILNVHNVSPAPTATS